MPLKDDILWDLDTVFFQADEHAENAAYTPVGGVSRLVTIIREEQDPSIMVEPPPGDEMTVRVRTTEVVHPRRGDRFVIDGESWHLRGNLGSGGGEARLVLTRSAWRV